MTNPALARIATYPPHVQEHLLRLRSLLLAAAAALPDAPTVEETLKWNEPTYLTRYGSTIRLDWKPKKPEQYALYFKCTSKLVPTFRQLYEDRFSYETTRALVFCFDAPLPEEALKVCIGLALRYHRVKHLPLLGAVPPRSLG